MLHLPPCGGGGRAERGRRGSCCISRGGKRNVGRCQKPIAQRSRNAARWVSGSMQIPLRALRADLPHKGGGGVCRTVGAISSNRTCWRAPRATRVANRSAFAVSCPASGAFQRSGQLAEFPVLAVVAGRNRPGCPLILRAACRRFLFFTAGEQKTPLPSPPSRHLAPHSGTVTQRRGSRQASCRWKVSRHSGIASTRSSYPFPRPSA
jgi:hypothetical protein